MLTVLKKIFGTSQERTIKRFKKIVADVNKQELQFQSLSDSAIREKTSEFKKRYENGETLDDLLVEAYAVVKNVCRRLSGTQVHVSGYDQRWDMVPYDVQILGAIALHKGYIAEMHTGEGKTLTATLPLYLNCLTGKPVHLITVNDYLAERDCQWVGSILRWMGLKTGVLTQKVPQSARKELYQCDVVYGTASEFGFDYLRDNSMASRASEQVQRGFYFAIIDEIDSVLIDEARTPLIISGPTPNSLQMYDKLKDGAEKLVKKQRDLCQKLSIEAKSTLEKYWDEETIPQDKKVKENIKQACKQLWLVSKGMPQNKVLRRAKEQPDLRDEIDKWDLFFHADQNKSEKLDLLATLYIVIDEKGNEFELTDKGIEAWVAEEGGDLADFTMLDLGAIYADIDTLKLSEDEKIEKRVQANEEDAQRKERAHNIRQLLRAHLLMEKDIDYIVEDGKIVIIDEHTGRPQPGRRFSDGLHQAIEAKESVEIQKETQTYASITLQNYFRMYDKLAGMTGTALTEAREFKEIYKLDVLQIPTHKPNSRQDANDEIYMTEREKYQAILNEIRKVHGQGRPILIGTESVDVSEKLSRILKQHSIKHNVLNAKNHSKEAEIIAEAGHHSAVTVATNMAGRGTDIKLKDDVEKLGGLHVIGTTRHQSRRIDRQLRGRSARLGDPGSSKFYISFEDPLMRLFSSPRLNAMIQRFRPPEGEPISASILNKSIETAQKRVEGRNYMMRKYTLEYDDVMNKQRQEVYKFRNEILKAKDLVPVATDLLKDLCESQAQIYLAGRSRSWDLAGYRDWLASTFPIHFDDNFLEEAGASAEEISHQVTNRVVDAFTHKLAFEISKAQREVPMLDIEKMSQEAIRSLIIGKVDELWQEHLLVMDYLRSEVSLRSVAQKDPLIEFKHEAFKLFEDLTHHLHTDVAKQLFKITVTPSIHPSLLQQMITQLNMETGRLMFDPLHEQETSAEKPIVVVPALQQPKTGRNEDCPCNSGKKYKRCCGINEEN